MAFYEIEVPTVAAVNGHAVGAGCDLSLMCDVRFADDDAEFAESFLRVGLVSGASRHSHRIRCGCAKN